MEGAHGEGMFESVVCHVQAVFFLRVFIVFIVFIVFHYRRTCTSYACLYVRAYSSTPIGYYYSPRSAQESIP